VVGGKGLSASAWIRIFLVGLLVPGTLMAQAVSVERVTDPHGVEIVTIRGTAAAWGSVGTVAAAPDLDIISPDPDDPWSFFGSVSAVRGFDDGSFVVSDGQSATLYFFDPDGTLIGEAGGQGDAAGRFRAVSAIPYVSGDTIWVWDAPSSRITAYTREGWMAGTTTILATPRLTAAYVMPDRSFLGVSRARALTGMLGAGDRLPQRDTVRFSRVEPNGTVSGQILEMPGEEWLRIQYAAADDFVTSVTAQLPIGRNAAYAVLPDGIVGGANDRFEISRWDLDGNLVRTSRFPDLDERLTLERIEELRDLWIEVADNQADRVEHINMVFDPELAPEVRPAFRRLLKDTHGHVWVQENDPWNPDRPRWWLFDDEAGVLIGHVEFPAGFEVHDIGPDYLLGVHRDFTELAHVRRYQLDFQLP